MVENGHTGGEIWEVESSAEENEEVERPVVKAKSKAVSSADSSRLGALPKASPVPKARPVPKADVPHQPVAKAAPLQGHRRVVPSKAAVVPPLRPRNSILPDSVVLVVREETPGREIQLQSGTRFIRQADTRNFNGFKELYDPVSGEAPEAIIAFDWHQVLDRSRVETEWSIGKIPRSNLALLQRIKLLVKDDVVLVIVSHIERSSKNKNSLINCLNQTTEVFADDLITLGLITREHVGVTGKYQTLFEVSHRGTAPCIFAH